MTNLVNWLFRKLRIPEMNTTQCCTIVTATDAASLCDGVRESVWELQYVARMSGVSVSPLVSAPLDAARLAAELPAPAAGDPYAWLRDQLDLVLYGRLASLTLATAAVQSDFAALQTALGVAFVQSTGGRAYAVAAARGLFFGGGGGGEGEWGVCWASGTFCLRTYVYCYGTRAVRQNINFFTYE